ncbi:MAG: cell division ATP-binding protein FtsE [Filifactoraceae bacterium]
MVKFENVSKMYSNSNRYALDNVSLNIEQGEFVFLVGNSGAGKSTFIKMLLIEEVPTYGNVYIDGEDLSKIYKRNVPKLRRKIGVVFQDFRLLPNKTVYENIAFAMEIIGKRGREIRRRVPIVLALVGLSDKAKSYPSQLSGGEMQRVGIARAIVNSPTVLIADEPTGNLDPGNSNDIMRLLEDINKNGTTVIVATHAKSQVDKMKKRVINLDRGALVRDEQGGNYENERTDI